MELLTVRMWDEWEGEREEGIRHSAGSSWRAAGVGEAGMNTSLRAPVWSHRGQHDNLQIPTYPLSQTHLPFSGSLRSLNGFPDHRDRLCSAIGTLRTGKVEIEI